MKPENFKGLTEIIMALLTAIAAAAGDGGADKHPIPNPNLLDCPANLGHVSSRLQARDMGKRHDGPPRTISDQKVKVVDGTGPHPNQNFVGGNTGFRHILVTQLIEATALVEEHSLHRISAFPHGYAERPKLSSRPRTTFNLRREERLIASFYRAICSNDVLCAAPQRDIAVVT
jgi:hypothetical protein